MNINGKINVFVREVGEKKIKIFETSFSRKDEDGNYKDNKSVRVNFSKDFLPDEKKDKMTVGYYYPIEILEGFLTTRGFDTKDGKHIIELALQIGRAKIVDTPKKVEVKQTTDEGAIVDDDGDLLPF